MFKLSKQSPDGVKVYTDDNFPAYRLVNCGFQLDSCTWLIRVIGYGQLVDYTCDLKPVSESQLHHRFFLPAVAAIESKLEEKLMEKEVNILENMQNAVSDLYNGIVHLKLAKIEEAKEKIDNAQSSVAPDKTDEVMPFVPDHLRGPIGVVEFAAANHYCVNLFYNNTWRTIEPYSLRRTNSYSSGHPNFLLYARKQVGGELRSYRVDRIQKVVVCHEKFEMNEFAIELGRHLFCKPGMSWTEE